MNKDYLKNNIKWNTNSLERVPTMNLGQLLYHLQVTRALGEFSYFDKPLVINMFKFDCHNHDTGIDVDCYILKGDEKLHIIRRTYWKYPDYRSSEDFYKKGAWDNKLEETIQMFRDKLIEHYTDSVNSLQKELDSMNKFEQDKINSFEEMFK